jgi:hypothetical protein
MHVGAWFGLGTSVPFARILSTICAVGALCTLAALGRQLEIRRPIPLVLLAVITPGLIWAASETRGYALLLWLNSATLLYALRLAAPPPPPAYPHRSRAAVAYAIVSYLALLASFYSGFVLAGQWVAAAIFGDRRGFRALSFALGVVALVFFPLIPGVLDAMRQHPTAPLPLDANGHPARTLIRIFFDAPLGGGPVFNTLAFLTIALVILAAIPATRALARHPSDAAERTLTIAAIVPFVVFGVLRVTNVALVEPRHTLVATPALITLWALWLSRTPPGPTRLATSAGLVALLAAAIYSFERNILQITDWRTAARIVSDGARADERVFLVPPQEALPFDYYYAGAALAAGLPVDVRLDSYDLTGYRIVADTQVTRRFAATGVTAGVWTVTAWRVEPVGSCADSIVKSVLRARFDTVTDLSIHGITILHARGPAATPRPEQRRCS